MMTSKNTRSDSSWPIMLLIAGGWNFISNILKADRQLMDWISLLIGILLIILAVKAWPAKHS